MKIKFTLSHDRKKNKKNLSPAELNSQDGVEIIKLNKTKKKNLNLSNMYNMACECNVCIFQPPLKL